MKAIFVESALEGRPLVWREAPAPEFGPDEVLVDVAAAALNRADLMQREGRYPPPPGASEILGLEAAGRIAALGANVAGWKRGDRVCALLPGGDGISGEIASLYALTRFLGEGVGVSLVQWGVAEARRLGLTYAFACTTSERVGQFFVRQGFHEVGQDRVPDRRWLGYDPERRMQVRCFRMDLARPAAEAIDAPRSDE